MGAPQTESMGLRHPAFSDVARIPTLTASVLRSMMGSAHSPRWGEPILSRHADVEFGSCRGIQPLAAMTKSLADPAARSLVVFSHGINDTISRLYVCLSR